jgi:hypothetical protein
VHPVIPVGPVHPVAPVGPVGPVIPVGPVNPVGPVGPVNPSDAEDCTVPSPNIICLLTYMFEFIDASAELILPETIKSPLMFVTPFAALFIYSILFCIEFICVCALNDKSFI